MCSSWRAQGAHQEAVRSSAPTGPPTQTTAPTTAPAAPAQAAATALRALAQMRCWRASCWPTASRAGRWGSTQPPPQREPLQPCTTRRTSPSPCMTQALASAGACRALLARLVAARSPDNGSEDQPPRKRFKHMAPQAREHEVPSAAPLTAASLSKQEAALLGLLLDCWLCADDSSGDVGAAPLEPAVARSALPVVQAAWTAARDAQRAISYQGASVTQEGGDLSATAHASASTDLACLLMLLADASAQHEARQLLPCAGPQLLRPAELQLLVTRHWETQPLVLGPPGPEDGIPLDIAAVAAADRALPPNCSAATANALLGRLLPSACHCPLMDLACRSLLGYVWQCRRPARTDASAQPGGLQPTMLLLSDVNLVTGGRSLEGESASPHDCAAAVAQGYTLVVRAAGSRSAAVAALQVRRAHPVSPVPIDQAPRVLLCCHPVVLPAPSPLRHCPLLGPHRTTLRAASAFPAGPTCTSRPPAPAAWRLTTTTTTRSLRSWRAPRPGRCSRRSGPRSSCRSPTCRATRCPTYSA